MVINTPNAPSPDHTDVRAEVRVVLEDDQDKEGAETRAAGQEGLSSEPGDDTHHQHCLRWENHTEKTT